MAADSGRIGFIVAAVFVVGWFALGTILNIRRGNRLLRWLENGLPLVGPRTTLRWTGSSGVELKVREALEPLKSAEVFILLEPRDLPLLWWLFRMRGRRDLLILRAELRRTPPFELEAFDHRAWSNRGLERRLTRDRWSPVAVPTGSALAAYGRGGGNDASELLPLATLPDLPLVRLAVRSSAPNLELQWHLTEVGRIDSRRVFEALYQLARRL
jgi:hypothetical protein